MKQKSIKLDEVNLIGLSVRTNNHDESDPKTAKIGALFADYQRRGVAEKLQNRQRPGCTYSVYTNYASDEHGDYTYFIGEAVTDIRNQPEELEHMVLQAGFYICFTTEAGLMPEIVLSAWQKIWQNKTLAQQRTYLTDFEIYDERAVDPSNTALDIYVGVKSMSALR